MSKPDVRIAEVLVSAGLGGYYVDDLLAKQRGVHHDGLFLLGRPVTRHFQRIREPGQAVNVMLVADDGTVGLGDCVSVTYSGAAGREPMLHPRGLARQLRRHTRSLVGQPVESFQQLDCEVLRLSARWRLPAAARFGLSQAALDLVSRVRREPGAVVVAREFALVSKPRRVPIMAQSGDERYLHVDKMIMKAADVIPHGLFDTPEALGTGGVHLLEYVRWLKRRLRRHAPDTYRPTFQFDVYGALGVVSGQSVSRMARFLHRLGRLAAPYPTRVECPFIGSSRAQTIEVMAALRAQVRRSDVRVEVVADEWCNTLADVEAFVQQHAADMIQIKVPDFGTFSESIAAARACRKGGVKVFLGGSCNETDISARATVQVAMGIGADQMYAKPGLDVDTGMMIVWNEMMRTLTWLKAFGKRA